MPKAVATYVSPEMAEAIDAAAAGEGLSRAAWTRKTLIKELVEQTRRVQGLPLVVEDVATLRRIADVLTDRNPPEAA